MKGRQIALFLFIVALGAAALGGGLLDNKKPLEASSLSSDSPDKNNFSSNNKKSTKASQTPEYTWHKLKQKDIKVVDGDTIRANEKHPLRLIGINAPDKKGKKSQCFAKESKKTLQRIINKGKLSYRTDSKIETNKYKRLWVYLYQKDENVNIKLLQKGMARKYYTSKRKGDFKKEIKKAEAKAKMKKRGLWWSCSKHAQIF